jgi:hypothetical protein
MAASASGIKFFSGAISGILGCLLLGGITGCGQKFPPNEYGTLIYEVPSLPEAKKPYEMPKLGPPLTEVEKRQIQSIHL